MLRNDGKYEVYVIEAKGEGDWFQYNMDFCALTDDQPYKDFSASGECWQSTGVHGTFDVRHALKMFNLMTKAKPEYQFRVTKYTIWQDSEVLWVSSTPEQRKQWNNTSQSKKSESET